MAIPTDPRFFEQWYLLNTGQTLNGTTGLAGIDHRVLDAWDDYTGVGVTIGVVDEGVESSHPDLAALYDDSLSYDARRNTEGGDAVVDGAGDAGDNHGTAVAGFFGATTDNGEGIAGIAHGARYGSIRIGLGTADAQADTSVDQFEVAFAKLSEFGIDTSNHSYGPSLAFADNFEDGAVAAYETYATGGRDDLGAVVVVAAGNGRVEGANAANSGFSETPYHIEVAATDSSGIYAYFSTPGAGLLVSAAGQNVLSTDRTPTNGSDPDALYAYTQGTSFSAPIVTGVTALMLEANPALGGRDIQQILAYSAYKPATAVSLFNPDTGIDAALQAEAEYYADLYEVSVSEMLEVLETPWDWQINGASTWNGGGLHVSHDYGFGLVDARAAVRLAESWSGDAQTYATWRTVTATQTVGQATVDGGSFSDTITVSQADGGTAQRVQVNVEFDGGDYEDVSLRLTSPSGTVSFLWEDLDIDVIAAGSGKTVAALQAEAKGVFGNGDERSLGSTQHWGESIAGDWTLTVVDDTADGDAPVLVDWTLSLYTAEEGAGDVYVFTDEFSDFAASDTGRTTLSDVDGIDTLNAAAVTSASVINLTAGATSLIDGVSVTIDAGTTIEYAHGGDATDIIVGNGSDNLLNGWRSADTLSGGDGADNLYGEQSADLLYGNRGDDNLFGGIDADQLYGGLGDDYLAGGSGDDTLDGGLGDDTLIGGDGADLFRTSTGGNDTVVDFDAGEGDTLDAGSTAVVAAFGEAADGSTVLDFGGGWTVTLVGVTGFEESWLV